MVEVVVTAGAKVDFEADELALPLAIVVDEGLPGVMAEVALGAIVAAFEGVVPVVGGELPVASFIFSASAVLFEAAAPHT